MKLTIITIGSRGDIQPIISLGRGLLTAGYDVTIATHAQYQDFVTENGMGFFQIDGNPQEMLEGNTGQEWLEAGRNPLKMLSKMRELAMPLIRQLTMQTMEVAQSADVLLFTTLAFYGVINIREKLDIPSIGIHLQPIQPTGDFPVLMMPSLPDWFPFREQYNRLSYNLLMRVNWRLFREPMDRVRAETLDLPPMEIPFHELMNERYPMLHAYSPHVILRPADWGDFIHVTGYWFFDEPDWTPPDDLLAFLDAGEPPIYIGFGSMTNRDPQSRTEIVVNALKKQVNVGY